MSGKVDMKIVLLGKEFGGKTSLVERYLHNRFLGNVPYQSTIGAAFGAKKLNAGGKTLTLGIWDTAGSERYESMSRIYYRGARAAVVCFDITEGSSFERVKFWIRELQMNEEHCKLYLCGTKKDLVDNEENMRQVDRHDVREYAEEIGAQVFETSSKTGDNIAEMFQKIAEDYVQDPYSSTEIEEDKSPFHVEESKPKLSCCS